MALVLDKIGNRWQKSIEKTSKQYIKSKVANKVKNANMVDIGPSNCRRLQGRRPAPASVLLLVVSYIVFVFKQPINQSTLKPPYLEPKPIKAGAVYS